MVALVITIAVVHRLFHTTGAVTAIIIDATEMHYSHRFAFNIHVQIARNVDTRHFS